MKRYIIIGSLLVISFILGKYSGPAMHQKTEFKTEIKTVKEETKTDENKIINETIVQRPDGTIETKRVITTDTTKITRSDRKDATKSIKTEITENRPNHQVTVLYQPSVSEYGIMYQHRIFSSLYVGGFVMNNRVAPEFGVAITLGF